jgi:DNA-binding ferritin-like protein (Dps family)
MDLAYDHIQEEALSPEEHADKQEQKPETTTLNSDFQEAYKAISSSLWKCCQTGTLLLPVPKSTPH